VIRTNELRGIITAKGTTQERVAKQLGITPKTFYLKMQKGVFGSDEIEKMIDILDIDNPVDIFFAKE
jgi:transcriptional regulator with XRE-family HTH domain